MKIIRVPISKIKLDPNNARKHDEKNLDAIKGSLAKFGQQKPVVLNKDDIAVAGNGTVMAAIALGWDAVDVVVSELDPTNQKAFALADNRTAELAAWDFDILGSTLQEIREFGFDIKDIGFDDSFGGGDQDPWGKTTENETELTPENAGATNRILLVYTPEEYTHVIALAEAAIKKLGAKDMSELFVKLLDGEN